MRLFVVLFLSISVLTACGGASEPTEQAEVAVTPMGTREAPYIGQGIIDEVGETQLLINHDDIPGFMPAMTMAFPITNEVEADGLQVGDEIMFKIEVLDLGGYHIFEIEPVAAEQ